MGVVAPKSRPPRTPTAARGPGQQASSGPMGSEYHSQFNLGEESSMGTWGVRAFENDDACDWAYGLDEATDFSLVEVAFSEVECTRGDLDMPEACNALAACEVVARALGRPGYQDSHTEGVDAWVEKHKLRPMPRLVERAQAAIDRVMGKNSFLREAFESSADADEWKEAMADLRARLKK